MTATVPRNNVAYWIQNLDFGTCLGVVDDLPVGRSHRAATLGARHRKEGVKSQEVRRTCTVLTTLSHVLPPAPQWVFSSESNDSWTIVNRATTFYLSADSRAPAATFFNPRSSPPSSANWTVEREKENNKHFRSVFSTCIIYFCMPFTYAMHRLMNGNSVLHLVSPYEVSLRYLSS
jgi:hypothetical protein